MERHRASISLTYDLFGTAKTALKFSAGKYHKKMETLGMVRVYNLAGGTDRRNWFDCDLIPGTSTCSGAALPTNSDDIAQENEIGPSSNLKFGLAPSRRADPNLKREYNWDYTVSIQHELLPRVSVNAAWYYSKFYNLPSTRNVLLTPSDYTSFQLASPLDNGEPITVFKPESGEAGARRRRHGHVQHQSPDVPRVRGEHPGAAAEWRDAARRLVPRAEPGREAVTCDTNNPNQLRCCDETGELYQELGAVPRMPFLHEFKFAAASPLPWGLHGGLSILSYAPANLFPGGRTQPCR